MPDAPASVHRVEIDVDARTHYHREHTELYYILECAAGPAIAHALEIPRAANGEAGQKDDQVDQKER